MTDDEKPAPANSPDIDIDAVDTVWSTRPEVVRHYVAQQSRYQDLCEEVAYIVRTRLKDSGIQVAAVTSRAKSIDGFCEKTTRKGYDDPLNEIPDLAGVRIVYLYLADAGMIERVIRDEFRNVKKEDKTEEQEADRFGYTAVHYLVHIGEKSVGARYDDLKDLTCEIQVRTILQDAWGIIDHHLGYKQPSELPPQLKRSLAELSVAFGMLDRNVDLMPDQRRAPVESSSDNGKKEDLTLNRNLDLKSLGEYLITKFPDRIITSSPAGLSHLLEALEETGYETVMQLDKDLARTEKAIFAYEESRGEEVDQISSVGYVRAGLLILDKGFANAHASYPQYSHIWEKALSGFRHLVEQSPDTLGLQDADSPTPPTRKPPPVDPRQAP